ncbi:MAG: hypothetical protein ACXWL5_03165 [Candidatus Chromulinivorax sp.]
MQIEQYQTFKFIKKIKNSGYYESLHNYSKNQNKIDYIQFFLKNYYRHIGKPEHFLSNIQAPNGEWGIGINEHEINVDMEKNLVYIGEIFDPETLNLTEQEFNIKYNNPTSVQICEYGFVPCNVMTKDNFIYLFTKWGNCLTNQKAFIIFYLDDNNWYDLASFDNQDAMQQFIDQHTK